MKANEKFNTEHKIYAGSPPNEVKHWIDFGAYKFRGLDNGLNELTENSSVDETCASRMNREGARSSIYNRVTKFHFAHGTMNLRECPFCGRPVMYFGSNEFIESNELKNIMPPLPIPFFDYKPKSKQEWEYQKNIHSDSLQCTVCASETFAYSAPTIMQSECKSKSSKRWLWF